jgi:type I restriction enzyme, S subunit
VTGQQIKLGYKQTEVGVIPEDWDARLLSDVAWFQEGPGLRNWQFTRSGMKVINVTNLENGFLNLDRTDRHISLEEFEQMYQHFAVDDKDIVMASSGNSYGKSAIVRARDLPLVMNTSVIRFKPTKTCDYGYLWVLLNSNLFKDQIDLMITGGAQPNFGPYHLRRIQVPVPTLSEQRAIAAALRDADAFIAALVGMIAKKRDLKQAAMQHLLTGKTRRPGFSGEWQVKRLGDDATLKARIGWQGLTTSEYLDSGDFILVTGTEFRDGQIAWQDCYFVDEGRYRQDSYIQLRKNDVLITKDGTIGKVALVRDLPKPATLNSGVFVVRPRSGSFDPVFFYYVMTSRVFDEFLSRLTAGSTIVHLYQKDFVGFAFNAPPTLAEQTAIAEVLSDMDADLAALEAQAAKARAVKQGMMQELLTGRVRLV